MLEDDAHGVAREVSALGVAHVLLCETDALDIAADAREGEIRGATLASITQGDGERPAPLCGCSRLDLGGSSLGGSVFVVLRTIGECKLLEESAVHYFARRVQELGWKDAAGHFIDTVADGDVDC